MGVDSRLLISSRWTGDDIVRCIEGLYGEAKTEHSAFLDYFIVNFAINENEKRSMNVHMNVSDYDFDCHLLSLGLWGEAENILKKIGEVFGGFFSPADTVDDNWQLIRGKLNRSDGLPYFIVSGIIAGKVNPEDKQSLLDHIDWWNKEYKSNRRL